MSELVILKHTGPGYVGSDPGTGKSLRAAKGEVVYVSPAKSIQLLKDFPKEWSYATLDPKSPEVVEAAPAVEVETVSPPLPEETKEPKESWLDTPKESKPKAKKKTSKRKK